MNKEEKDSLIKGIGVFIMFWAMIIVFIVLGIKACSGSNQ
jgi:hypothetical protein